MILSENRNPLFGIMLYSRAVDPSVRPAEHLVKIVRFALAQYSLASVILVGGGRHLLAQGRADGK